MDEDQRATRPADRRQVALNAAAGWAANIGKIVIQLVLLPVMAHLLGPAEFGLYALALPTISFFSVLADGGLGTSLAREDESATVVWSTAFWALLATGIALAIVTTLWGLALARLAGQPSLAGLMAVLSLTFIPITMAVVPSARLTRRGNLVVYAIGDLTATILGVVVAIGMALAHFGAWSLAAQYVTAMSVRASVLNVAAFAPPTWAFDLSALRSHLRMGSALLGSRLFEFTGRLIENLVFGRVFGTAALGTFTFANQMPRFLSEAASNPLWAALYAHALHADGSSVAALQERFCRLLATILFPTTMLLSAAAPELFAVVLGPRWEGAATLIRIIAPFFALSAIAATNIAILLARGRSFAMFVSIAGTAAARVVAVLFGVYIGQIGVAWGLGLGLTFGAVALFIAATHLTKTSLAAAALNISPPLLAAVIAGAVCYGILALHPSGVSWIGVSLLAGAVAYLIALVLLEGDRLQADLHALYRLLVRQPGIESV